MLAIDIETTALEPEDGEIRLIQLSDGKRVIVYDVRNKPNYTLTAGFSEHDLHRMMHMCGLD
jgi:ribonuclease D